MQPQAQGWNGGPGDGAKIKQHIKRDNAIDPAVECGNARSEVATHTHSDQDGFSLPGIGGKVGVKYGSRRHFPLGRKGEPLLAQHSALPRSFERQDGEAPRMRRRHEDELKLFER